MYKVIGVDGRPYGPVSAEHVQQWIRENRVRGDTLIQPEGSSEWKPLASFPEFAPHLESATAPSGGVPPPITPSPSDIAARASTKIPAGVCGILLGGLGVHKFILGYTGAGVIMLLITCLTCGIGSAATCVIGLIEGIIYLTKSDEEFVRTYVDNRKEWF